MRILALLLCFLSAPAWALSCARTGPADAFAQAQADKADWVVVYGRLTVDEARLPTMSGQGQSMAQKSYEVPAHIKGRALDKTGFGPVFERVITLRVTCTGPWCGGAKSGANYLAFLRKEGRRYVAPVDPCGTMFFGNPDKADLNAVKSCMRGRCPAPKRR